MVACPGKERLVKVGTRGRDAKDAGNFDAYKLQCLSLIHILSVEACLCLKKAQYGQMRWQKGMGT